jgi:hypothetical protein
MMEEKSWSKRKQDMRGIEEASSITCSDYELDSNGSKMLYYGQSNGKGLLFLLLLLLIEDETHATIAH